MKRTVLLAAGAVTALAVATGGTAAVQALVTGAQIKDGTIESRDIKNGSIGRADIADSAEATFRGRRGAVGPQGSVGPAGERGPAGPQGATGSQGPTGSTGAQGALGPKGDPGAGVNVTGTVATVGALPSGAAEGDAYIVSADGRLYVWNGSTWIDTGEVRGPQGPTGATGLTGPQGSAGPAGPAGPAGTGLSGYQIITGSGVLMAPNEVLTAGVDCPPGKVVTGGGVSVTDPQLAGLVSQSFPKAGGAGWWVSIWNDSTGTTTMTPYAICASS